MSRSRSVQLCALIGLAVLLAVSMPLQAATRTFDFEGPAYGNPDELCSNKPVPPLFSIPEFSFTKDFLWGDALPRGETVGCGHGLLGGDNGSDSYLTAGLGTVADRLAFSWENATIDLTGANWTAATLQLTKSSGFLHYYFFEGDKITITAGTGVTPGVYDIASKVDANTIVLATSIAAADVTDASIAGTLSHDVNSSWARIITSSFSYTTPLFPNPTVRFAPGCSIKMKVTAYGLDASELENAAGQLELSLLIQETGRNLPLGEDGGTAGNVELAGVDSALAGPVPVGGVTIGHSTTLEATTIEWKFVDRLLADGITDGVDVKVTVPGGSPVTYNKSIVPFSSGGDGLLSAPPYDRGTLNSLAIRKPTTDTTSVKWFVWIDDIVLDAPGITDPVKVKLPVSEGQTTATVEFINPAATAVKLYKDSGSGFVLLQTATPPFSDPINAMHKFTGLAAMVVGQRLSATQLVDGHESDLSDPVTVSAFGIIDDFTSGVTHLPTYSGNPVFGTYYDVSPIAWSYAEAREFPNEPGNQSLAISDGGWTNGVYAIYESAFATTGTFHLQARMHVVDSGAPAGMMQYQMGAAVPGAFTQSVLAPCTTFGTYTGLTTANDTAIGPKTIRTKDFDAVEGENLLVAFCSDVASGGWNGLSYTWNGWAGVTIYVDDIKLIPGPPPVCSASEVPAVSVVGPLEVGNTTVNVSGVGAAANKVSVYVNGEKKGELDTSTTGAGTKTVIVSSTLLLGDLVTATQTYPGCVSGEIEGLQSPSATVGGGKNRGGLRLTLGLRETKTSSAIGADGGQVGPIEWVGATTVTASGPQGKLITPSASWQQVTFYPVAFGGQPKDPVIAYDAGNGVLNGGTFNKGVLECLAVSPDPANPNTGPYELYFDNVACSTAAPPVPFEEFESYAVGTPWVMFRNPRYLTTFAPWILAEPAVSEVSDAFAYAGTKSSRQLLQFSQENRWARLTTYSLYDTPSPYRANPTVQFNRPISLWVLYPPNATACNQPTVASVSQGTGTVDTLVTGVALTGSNFQTGLTKIKLVQSGQADILAKNVAVSDSGNLICDFDLTGAALGMWDIVCATCSYSAPLVGQFEVVAGGPSCNTPQADLNGDNSVDGADYGLFAGCFNGTGNPINPGCECADLDGDLAVDGADYGLFAGCFNGTGNPSPCS